jgi:uncharacterized protein YodC (DUF2158 family)
MTVVKPGDLVVLKSGGPVMTVDTVNTDIFDDDKVTGILCAWFVGDKLERGRFDPGAIAPVLTQDAASGTVEMQPPEAIGEYKAMLDQMASAMNEAAEADASKPSAERPKRARKSGDEAAARRQAS